MLLIPNPGWGGQDTLCVRYRGAGAAFQGLHLPKIIPEKPRVCFSKQYMFKDGAQLKTKPKVRRDTRPVPCLSPGGASPPLPPDATRGVEGHRAGGTGGTPERGSRKIGRAS